MPVQNVNDNTPPTMVRTFRYSSIDRRARRLTVIWFIVIAAVITGFWLLHGEGSYLVAWAVSLTAAVVMLYAMSIPRKVVIGETALEIRCTIEITHLHYSDIRSVRRISRKDMQRKYVLFGSYGFFGYYGYYLDIRRWETIKLYCTSWDNFIEITDVYEKRYIINNPSPDDLVGAVTTAMRRYYASNPS